MKTIIAGSRTIKDYKFLLEAILESGFIITEVISGNAEGADKLGERFAKENGIKLSARPADWPKYGKAAGPIRNEEMANEAECLIALWDGISKGTKHMIQIAKAKGLKIYIKYEKPVNPNVGLLIGPKTKKLLNREKESEDEFTGLQLCTNNNS
jgi:hypothetical protein